MRNSLFIVFITIITILFFNCTVFSEIKEREEWHLLMMNEKPVGVSFSKIQKSGDGKFYEYNSFERVLLSLFNKQEEIRFETKQIFYPDLRLKSIEFSIGDKLKVEGEIIGNKLEVFVTLKGTTIQKSIELKEGLYSLDILPDIVRSFGLNVGNSFTIPVVNPETQKIENIQIDILEKSVFEYKGEEREVYKIKTELPGKRGIYAIYAIDDKGITYEVNIPKTQFLSKKVSQEEAKGFQPEPLDLLRSSFFKSNVTFIHPNRVNFLKLKVRWKGVDINEFNFKDRRQKIINIDEKDDKYEITLEIKKQKIPKSKHKIPIKGEIFSKYLQDDFLVQSKDERIVRLAKEIIGDEKDALSAVSKIVNWMYKNIKPGVEFKIPIATEVLELKKGICADFAILFAALARAVGIPTKFSLGIRYSKIGGFVGHIWNEVYIDEWIPVDTTRGQIEVDALNIKFTESDTVEGTQKIRFELIDNLDVEVLEYKEEKLPLKLKGKLKTGFEDGTYMNIDYQFRISKPDKDWMIRKKDISEDSPIHIKPKDNEEVLVELFFRDVNPIMKPMELMELYERDYKELEGFKEVEKRNIKFRGLDATLLIYERGKEEKTRVQKILVIYRDIAYIITFIAPKEECEKYKKDFKKIIDSFVIIK